VLYAVGELHLGRGNLEPAEAAYRRCSGSCGNWVTGSARAFALRGLGACRLRRDDHAPARESLDHALRISREAGLRFVEARVLEQLGDLSRTQSRHADAITLLRQAVDLWQTLGTPMWQARTLHSLADACDAAGDHPEAADARARADALLAQLSHPTPS
jgi:tetratricopeptide (TPR) repeat protein